MRAKKPYMVLKGQRQSNRMILLRGAEKSVPCIKKTAGQIMKESIATKLRRYCISRDIDIQFPSVYNGKVKFCACG